MCGIVGIFLREACDWPADKSDLLQTMAQQIEHRGPDAEGCYFDGPIGLGHRRLSIIDLQGGAQPMQTSDGELALSFNGEIFNFIELRQTLQQKGYCFTTQSDTEVILHLYREYGQAFAKHLNGQFAIALWDKRERILLLVRDRVGICPLYYSADNRQFIFASEIKALRPALPQSLDIDTQSLDHIFTGWTCIAPNTIFKGIYQVSPGEMLVVDCRGHIQKSDYWQLAFPTCFEEYDHRPEAQLVEELHEQLLTATRLRLRSDVPVGAYLSGGLDSSVLVALMHTQTDARLRTFSLQFADKALDESEFQRKVVDYLGTEHTSTTIEYADIARQLESSIWHAESPILRTAPAPMGILSQLVHDQGYRVVLTGEGADEVLGGYDIFKEAKVRQFWAKHPESTFRPLLIGKLYPYMDLPKGDASVYLKRFFGVGLDTPDLLWHSHLPRWQTTRKAKMFFHGDVTASLKEGDYEARIAALFPEEAKHWHSFHRAQYLEIKTLMSGYLLCSQGDRMLTKHSVEGRFPYLDHTLIEFANKLPPKVKMKAMKEKNLLKLMAKAYLPAEIGLRPKQPYRAPNVSASQEAMFGGGLQEFLSQESLQKTALFDSKKVGLLLKKANAGRTLNTAESQALTGILSTQILHHQFCH